MKLETHKSISFSAVLLVAVNFACMPDDVLDQNPQTTISDATFWRTTNDLKLYCNNFYQLLPANPSNNATYYIDNNSDHLIPESRSTRLNGESLIPESGGGWAYSDWASIRNTNYFLANYHFVSSPRIETNGYIGEGYFFRAWFYFEKLTRFGALPWIDKPVGTDAEELLNAPRLPRNEIAEKIITDLDSAIKLLPSRTGAEIMRVNKEVAQAFKTRVCLYEGTWEKYHAGTPFGVSGENGSKFLAEAVSEAEALMTSGTVGLDNVGATDGYQELFNQVSYTGSQEILFWRAYERGVLTTLWNRYSNTGGATGMTKRLVDSYLCTDGQPISISPDYQGDATLENVASNRDPRLAQTMYLPGDLVTNYPPDQSDVIFQRPGFTLEAGQRSTSGYVLKKGNNTDPGQVEFTTRGLIFIRFAEVLLNFAEAKAELEQLTQADVDKSVNLLRARVGMIPMDLSGITTDPDWLFPGLSPVINEIRRERSVELACEGFRLDDILRWAAAPELIIGYKPKGAKWAQWDGEYPTLTEGINIFVDENGYLDPYHIDVLLEDGFQFRPDKDYLMPLPIDQLTLNPGLDQNPGW